MEVTRTYNITRKLPPSTINVVKIVDINNSECVHSIRNYVSRQQLSTSDKNSKIGQLATAALGTIINEQLRESKDHHALNITLNLYDRYPSLWFWNNCLFNALQEYPQSRIEGHNFVVTFQTDIDRQQYFDDSGTLRKFQTSIIPPLASEVPDDTVEYQTKVALLHIYNTYGMDDSEMGEIITRCSSLQEVLQEIGDIV